MFSQAVFWWFVCFTVLVLGTSWNADDVTWFSGLTLVATVAFVIGLRSDRALRDAGQDVGKIRLFAFLVGVGGMVLLDLLLP